MAWTVDRAKQLNSKLSLQGVFVHALEAKQVVAVPEPRWTFTMHLEGTEWVQAGSEVIAIFPIRVVVQHDGGASRTDLAEIRVALRLHYRTAPEFSASDLDFVNDFLGTAGWLHAWPYIRAEVQSISMRLGLPPLVLPVLLAGQTANIPSARAELAPMAPDAKAEAPSATTSTGEKSTAAKSKKRRAP